MARRSRYTSEAASRNRECRRRRGPDRSISPSPLHAINVARRLLSFPLTRVGMRWPATARPSVLPCCLNVWQYGAALDGRSRKHGGHRDAPQNLPQDIGEHGQPGGGSARFPAPAISQGAAAKTLRFVPQANLANFDPIWGTQYVVRNASAAGLGHALRRRRASCSRSGRWSRARRSRPTA